MMKALESCCPFEKTVLAWRERLSASDVHTTWDWKIAPTFSVWQQHHCSFTFPLERSHVLHFPSKRTTGIQLCKSCKLSIQFTFANGWLKDSLACSCLGPAYIDKNEQAGICNAHRDSGWCMAYIHIAPQAKATLGFTY